MAKILIVEDDPQLADLIVQCLSRENHLVEHVDNGADALSQVKLYIFDLIILDWNLPEVTGLGILQEFRARGGVTPVLFLTGRRELADKLEGLDAGADDYLTKPFALPELEARIKALLRRASGGKMQLVHGPLEFDLDGRIVLIDGKPADFSVREMAILEVLMQRSGQVVIKTRLAQRISDWENEIGVNTIEVYIHRLRKRLEPRGVRIRTIHGLGYLLEPYVTT